MKTLNNKNNLILSLLLALQVSLMGVCALASELAAPLDELELVYDFDSSELPEKKYENELLRVMWWNIDCATTTAKVNGSKSYKSNLEKNILNILSSELRPEVLILGEYCPIYLSDNFEKVLQGKYKYKHHLERNIPQYKTSSGKTNQRNGIMVLSDHPLKLLADEPLYASNEKLQNDKKNRRYILLQIAKGSRKVYLNPLHLYNPWREYRAQYGLISTFMEIEGGSENPNALQGRQVVEKNLNYVSPESSLLVIGDFNSPKSFYAVNGYTYKALNNSFQSLIADTSDTYLDSGAFMSSSIDHAFGQNLKALYGRVLPLAGSGHLPLYLIVE